MPKINSQTVRGMNDILPQDQKYWFFIEKIFEKSVISSGFSKISTPIIEKASLFERPIGKETDIIEKEMYILENKGKETHDRLVLRPEATASVVRAYIEHGMKILAQPVKLYYWGPMFRHDRPQKGRHRQFHQLGVEVIGDIDPIIDAEIISLSYRLLSQIGIKDMGVQINSIGSAKSRIKFAKELKKYYKKYISKLCRDCRKRYQVNPLRLLDCKDESCERYKENAPQIVDFLDKKDKEHFTEVLEYLDELSIPYELNTHLVRGLDYYTRTVFEIWPTSEKISNPSGFSLGGGGRYDDLVELLGGAKNTPGVGFSFGIERIIEVLKLNGAKLPHHDLPDIFVIQLGKIAKKKSLKVEEQLREEGFRVVSALGKESIKSQLKQANKMKVPLALILGQKEVLDGTIIVRDMYGGMQEVVDWASIVDEVKKRLPRDDDQEASDVFPEDKLI